MKKLLRVLTLAGALGCTAAMPASEPVSGEMPAQRCDMRLRPARAKVVPESFRGQPVRAIGRPGAKPRPVMFRTPYAKPLAADVAKAAEDLKATALLINAASWNRDEGQTAEGMYSVSLEEGAKQPFAMVKDLTGLPWNFFGTWGYAYSPSAFYLSLPDYQKGQICGENRYIFNPENWEITRQWQTPDEHIWINSSTYDPTSGLVYAQMTHSSKYYNFFGTFDIASATPKEICRAEADSELYSVYFIACDSGGQLYGLYVSRKDEDNGSIYLCKLDKTTGAIEKIGRTGLPNYNSMGTQTCVAIDPTDTFMYVLSGYSFNGSAGRLWCVRLDNGAATAVYDLPDNEGFKMMFFPAKPSSEAPQAPRALTADFTDDSLSGNVSFTMPDLTVGEAQLSGTLSYEVTFNGVLMASGAAQAGSGVTTPVTVSAGGLYTIGVRARSDKGYSPIATIQNHIGTDVPCPLKNVRAIYADGLFTITWDETEALNGGYFDRSKVTYDLLLYNNNPVQTGLTGTSATYAYEEPQDGFARIWFCVRPVYDGTVYAASSSNHVNIGNMTLPWTSSFSANDNGFAYVNANGDHRAWKCETLWGWLSLDGNVDESSDDWAICPPAPMEAGKAYRVNFSVRPLMPSEPETISIWAGPDSTLAALTTCILHETALSHDGRGHEEHAYFAPPASGKYHFALRCTTGPQNGRLYIDEVRIDEPVSATLAAEMTDFTADRAADGSLRATLSFTASPTDIAGKPLASIEKIEICRDGEVIHTLPATPGQKISWDDTTVPDNGNYTYSVAAYTAEGRGIASEREVFVGVYVPEEPASLTVRRGVDTGQFVIEWECDAVDVSGKPFDKDQLKFNIYHTDAAGDPELIAEGISAKRKVYRECEADDEQHMVWFGVEPINSAGTGYGKMSEAIPSGRPDGVPYKESFAGKTPHHLYTIDFHPYYYATWLFAGDTDFEDITSHDGDNGFLVFGSEEAGNSASYVSGNINLGDVATPVMTYYYYTWEYTNTIELAVNDGTGWKTLDSFAADEAYATTGKRDWTRRSVDLGAYRGKIIQWKLVGKCVDAIYTLIDNIYIGQDRVTDLAAGKISAPTRVKGGETFTISTTVTNLGSADSPTWTARLFADGKNEESMEFASLGSGMSKRVEFKRRIGLGEDPEHTYRIEIEAAGDEDDTNNTSGDAVVRRTGTIYPEPAALTAEAHPQGARLQWQAPDLGGTRRVTVTDDVEDYTDFSIGLPNTVLTDDNTGDWTMIDGDDAYTYTFNGGNFPNAQQKMAYIVFNPSAIGIDLDMATLWRPHSGNKMFAAFLPVMARVDDTQVPVAKDDWLVSPLLTGDAQTVSFHARTMSSTYAKEKFEVYYTTGDPDDTEAMTRIGEPHEADYEWEEYTFELPAGARHFAIRNFGSDGFVFMVDDIVYQPGAAAGMGLELLGYNIYRDGVLLNGSEPVKELSYVDTRAGGGARTFQVTAVYDRGESMPARASIELSGLTDATAADARAYGGKGLITVESDGRQPVGVLRPDGRLMRRIESPATVARIEAPAGIYIVTVGPATFKVTVN